MKGSLAQSLIDRSRIQSKPLAILVRLGAILGFAGLIAFGAHAKILLTNNSVPFTLQTFFVLLAAAFLGGVDAAAAVAIYLLLGAFGVPLFALSNTATGFAYFTGVTGGYLVGFFAAVMLVSFGVRKFESVAIHAAAFCAGSLLILAFGTVWLKFVLDTSLAQAFGAGFAPFLLGDGIKTAVAFVLYRALRAPRKRI